MSSAVELSSARVSCPAQASNSKPVQHRGFDLEDQLTKVSTSRPGWRDCVQEFGTRTRVLPRMPAHPEVGPVGSSESAWGGAAVGFVVGTIIWAPLGITSLAVTNHYHSVVRGVLFLALGIPGFTLIGAGIGACLGSDGKAI